ncbi:hypothetical protein ABI_18340 [Asticcacaulis biprosthecium C19]|uniref:DUF1800 domain-containing protein n=1 Tax=Asticcacaulis biprosthecium C19 TaxID=715226 RepID=F4QKU2_9CAUL|nr:DUF1800 family protein [Asticcacaulis biprosthecium]EGF93394.1 hypothetical protein ABI_18340 [Asticcacaulis biprosthecium C19]
MDFESALALSRFGLGSTAAGLQALPRPARDLILDEIDRGRVADPGHGSLPTSEALIAEGSGFFQARLKPGETKLQSPVGPAVDAEVTARYHDTLMTPPVGFSERLVMFWMNHFAVSLDKGTAVHISAGAYEREAIRPYVYGRFTDMLLAVETHPTMLYYLDNVTSTGPNSRTGQRMGRDINENLAREIMELHTLGVDSGYSQADVTAFAKALTGWTANKRPGGDGPVGGFTFRKTLHEPGGKTILGEEYHEDGFFQAADILVSLSNHPATAKHLSTKLARHFVADNPPKTLVDRLSSTWLDTGGDLQAVYATLIDSEEAWAPTPVKLRTPQEHLIAMLRATDAQLTPALIKRALTAMGQPWWKPPGPNGFSDLSAAWLTPEGLSARMEVAALVAAKTSRDTDPREFAPAILGPRLSDGTLAAIERADTLRQGISLAFMAPEFVRR